ncbi:MAG: universal stress protein [Desulfovibrio sp.]|nr:universal stress protein [Desulfovibrio sp.]
MNAKSILLAVDGSQNSLRAAEYLGEIAGGGGGFRIVLLSVLAPPDRDIFRDPRDFQAERDRRNSDAMEALDKAAGILVAREVDPAAVQTRIMSCLNMDLAGTILAVRQESDLGTVVVGRRGLSKAEEFLLGSVSSRVTRHAKDFTVWVVG